MDHRAESLGVMRLLRSHDLLPMLLRSLPVLLGKAYEFLIAVRITHDDPISLPSLRHIRVLHPLSIPLP